MDGLTLGQDVYFLGFPLGMTIVAVWNGYLPLVKQGIVSAVDSRDKTSVTIYVDGFNNAGFSGGPIVFEDARTGKLKVAGVISAYRVQEQNVLWGANPTNLTVLSNSGILVGQSIHHALEVM